MRGISITEGAPSLRCPRVVLGSTFSSSAIVGRGMFALASREVGGEVILLPFVGDMVGDFAGLLLRQLTFGLGGKARTGLYAPMTTVGDQELLQAAYPLIEVLSLIRPRFPFCSKSSVQLRHCFGLFMHERLQVGTAAICRAIG